MNLTASFGLTNSLNETNVTQLLSIKIPFVTKLVNLTEATKYFNILNDTFLCINYI